jgi:ankyrin repeat protein
MVELLLARGAPIDARNLAGSTALFFAAEGGRTAIVQRLIEGGADVNLPGRSGVSPLSAASYGGHDAVVAALLDRGADHLVPDQTGKPAIVYAAAAGHFDTVARLLARKVDVNARYANDLTLLMWASGPDDAVPEAEAVRLVSALLDAGARIDDQDARGRTALMIAAEGGHARVVDVLLAHGADRSHTDKGGKRAADLTVVSALRERLGQP